MNEIVNKFLLAGDKFMPEMHLKQPGFTYSACGPFTKNKERNQKFKETGDTIFTKTNLIRLVFNMIWHMAYEDFKDLEKKSEKVSRDKAFNIAKNPKYDGYQRGLASMVYKFFDKKSKDSGVNIEVRHNEQLAEELNKPIIRNVKKEPFVQDLKIIFGVLV